MARKSVREQWAAKLAGKGAPPGPSRGVGGRGAGAAEEDHIPHRPGFRGIVLGIDPSLRGSGLAVVEVGAAAAPAGPAARLLESRTLRLSPSLAEAECLAEISRAVGECAERYPVDHAAVEETIYVQNFRTAQILGMARGAALAAVALRGIPAFGYPPLRIKQAVVGFGRASKHQVAQTVMGLLGHREPLEPDEADAVAAALCHAFTHRG